MEIKMWYLIYMWCFLNRFNFVVTWSILYDTLGNYDNQQTEQITIMFKNILSLQHHEFSDFLHLKTAILSNNKIQHVDNLSFLYTEIVSLDLNNNRLSNIPNLSSNYLTLQHLNLSYNSIAHVACEDIEQLPNLLELDLSHNLLQTVPGVCADDVFTPSNYIYLKHFFLNDNPQLKNVAQNSLQGLVNLKMLSLVNTGLSVKDLELITQILSLENQVVIKKVAKNSFFHYTEEITQSQRNYSNMKMTAKGYPKYTSASKGRLKRSTSNATTSNDDGYNDTLLQESLLFIYNKYLNSTSSSEPPVEAPISKYIGWICISMLILEGCILICADMTELVRKRERQKKWHKANSRNSKNRTNRNLNEKQTKTKSRRLTYSDEKNMVSLPQVYGSIDETDSDSVQKKPPQNNNNKVFHKPGNLISGCSNTQNNQEMTKKKKVQFQFDNDAETEEYSSDNESNMILLTYNSVQFSADKKKNFKEGSVFDNAITTKKERKKSSEIKSTLAKENTSKIKAKLINRRIKFL